MGWFGPQSGGCTCCDTFVCDNCAALTYFTISGLTNGSCASGCDAKNGTYVFRTIGNYFTSGAFCGWTNTYGGDNCGANDFPQLYIGPVTGSCQVANNWGIDFSAGGSGIIITVQISLQYSIRNFSSDKYSSYQGTWKGTFTNCAAAVGATLSFDSSVIIDCGPGGGTGDMCNLLGATITLG